MRVCELKLSSIEKVLLLKYCEATTEFCRTVWLWLNRSRIAFLDRIMGPSFFDKPLNLRFGWGLIAKWSFWVQRMLFSPNSVASKARTKALNRTRLSNQVRLSLHLCLTLSYEIGQLSDEHTSCGNKCLQVKHVQATFCWLCRQGVRHMWTILNVIGVGFAGWESRFFQRERPRERLKLFINIWILSLHHLLLHPFVLNYVIEAAICV